MPAENERLHMSVTASGMVTQLWVSSQAVLSAKFLFYITVGSKEI